MCGRYALFGNWKSALAREVASAELKEFEDIIDNYNVSPLQSMPVLIGSDHEIQLTTMRWGFIPSWAKDESMSAGMINARAETVSEKPSFKRAFKQRRCIIPMNGFYEWASSAKGKKQPVYCSSNSQDLFYAAGIWEHWESQDKHVNLNSYAIITVPANSIMKRYHERMPAFLSKEQMNSWLFDSELAPSLLNTLPGEDCKAIFVGLNVNNARINTPDLILETEPALQSEQLIPTKPPSGDKKNSKNNGNSEQGSLF
jgi:putative SOS response-associated peptidase YedK